MKKITKQMSLPRGTGRKGVLAAVDTLLKTSGVQEVRLQPGRLSYDIHFPDVDPEDDYDEGSLTEQLRLSFRTGSVSTLLQHKEIHEVPVEGDFFSSVGALFRAALQANYHPVCLATGVNFPLQRLGMLGFSNLEQDAYIMGHRLFQEAEIPQDALVLCCARAPSLELDDVAVGFKISLSTTNLRRTT